jgi:hypothetical protein
MTMNTEFGRVATELRDCFQLPTEVLDMDRAGYALQIHEGEES